MKPISEFRKAIAAFVLGLLSMPIGAWVAGDEPFSAQSLWTGVAAAILAGVTVYLTPNERPL